MRALLVVVASFTVARAQPVRRTPLSWSDLPAVVRRTESGAVQIGRGIATGWRHDVHVGFHVTDRWLVRVRERIESREAELAYAFGVHAIEMQDHSFVHVKLFALAGAGVTNDRDAIGHAGVMLRTYPVEGAAWIALELGVRWGGEAEAFAAMSLLFSKRTIRSLRSLVSL